MANREKRKPHGVLSQHRNKVQTQRFQRWLYNGDTVGYASRKRASMERSLKRVRRRESEGSSYYEKVGFTGKRRSGKPRNNNKYPSTTKNNKRIFGVF
jgi:hypothetical protein